jgi:hypothetical protein
MRYAQRKSKPGPSALSESLFLAALRKSGGICCQNCKMNKMESLQ